MKIYTTRQLLSFVKAANNYLRLFPNERSLLTFALNRLVSELQSFYDRIAKRQAEKIEELEVMYCLKNKDGSFVERDVVVGNQVVFRKSFDVEGDRNKRTEYDEFEEKLLAETAEFTPRIVSVPLGFPMKWINEFTGFVFAELTEEQLKELYFEKEENK